jgi:hypothetical protein
MKVLCTLLPLLLLTCEIKTARSNEEDFSCIDLKNFVSSNDTSKLDQFMAGGDIVSTDPVYFDIPRMNGDGSPVILCLDNVPNPRSVKGVSCLGTTASEGEESVTDWSKNCYLALGRRAVEDDQQETCRSQGQDDSIGTCYGCTCSIAQFESGQLNRSISSRCGPLEEGEEWGVSCTDVPSGRGFNTTDGGPSNFSSVQVALCPHFRNLCDECQITGSTSPFKVRKQRKR